VGSAYNRLVAGVVLAASVFPPLVFTIAPLAVPAFLGARWSPSVIAFQIFATYSVGRILVSTGGPLLLSLGQSRAVFECSVATLICQAIGLAAGMPFGLRGAVAGWSAGTMASFAFLVIAVRAATGTTVYAQFLPLRDVLIPMAAQASTMALVFALVEQPLSIELVLAATAGLFVYAALAPACAAQGWQALKSAFTALRDEGRHGSPD
jgi:O-antigen/teichoic acid export membrane protein